VIARNSSFAYKGKAVDVKLVGRELGLRPRPGGPESVAGVRYSGRYRTDRIRDGVLLSVG